MYQMHKILHMVSMLTVSSGSVCTRQTSQAETTFRTGETCQTCRFHLQSSSVAFRHDMCFKRMVLNLTHLLLFGTRKKEGNHQSTLATAIQVSVFSSSVAS